MEVSVDVSSLVFFCMLFFLSCLLIPVIVLVRDALLSHAMLEQAISVPESITPMSFNFIGVKNFLVSSEGRPRIDISHGIERRFAQSRLEKTVINTMFGHMINPMITTRAYMNIEPIRLHLSLKSLRRGTVQITTEQEDPTGIWVEDSGIVSWNV